mgnify:CR=1 FL=1
MSNCLNSNLSKNQISFILLLLREDQLQEGKIQFILQNYRAAIDWIETVDHSRLKMTKEEFDKYCFSLVNFFESNYVSK